MLNNSQRMLSLSARNPKANLRPVGTSPDPVMHCRATRVSLPFEGRVYKAALPGCLVNSQSSTPLTFQEREALFGRQAITVPGEVPQDVLQ